jgi:AcrR family transcriptional regulator
MGLKQGTAGRPRHEPRRREGTSGHEEILDAAAQLFTEKGFAATSTREIALAVGIKQASLYYHFPSKEGILAELLSATVRPSLAAAARLSGADAPPQVRLWALAAFDVRVLCSGRWNLGALYLLPELRTQRLASFWGDRQLLRDAYGRLVAEAAGSGLLPVPDPAAATNLVFGLVESTITLRWEQDAAEVAALAGTIADGTLKLLSCNARQLAAARRRGERLLQCLPEGRVRGQVIDVRTPAGTAG